MIIFGLTAKSFFSDIRHQKRGLAPPNECFGNTIAKKRIKLASKTSLLEVPYGDTLYGRLPTRLVPRLEGTGLSGVHGTHFYPYLNTPP